MEHKERHLSQWAEGDSSPEEEDTGIKDRGMWGIYLCRVPFHGHVCGDKISKLQHLYQVPFSNVWGKLSCPGNGELGTRMRTDFASEFRTDFSESENLEHSGNITSFCQDFPKMCQRDWNRNTLLVLKESKPPSRSFFIPSPPAFGKKDSSSSGCN